MTTPKNHGITRRSLEWKSSQWRRQSKKKLQIFAHLEFAFGVANISITAVIRVLLLSRSKLAILENTLFWTPQRQNFKVNRCKRSLRTLSSKIRHTLFQTTATTRKILYFLGIFSNDATTSAPLMRQCHAQNFFLPWRRWRFVILSMCLVTKKFTC